MGDISVEQQEQAEKKQGYTIKPCTCKHGYQDSRYGPGQRVWNIGKGKRTCTVCGVSVSEK
jgi:hypothetical protein